MRTREWVATALLVLVVVGLSAWATLAIAAGDYGTAAGVVLAPVLAVVALGVWVDNACDNAYHRGRKDGANVAMDSVRNITERAKAQRPAPRFLVNVTGIDGVTVATSVTGVGTHEGELVLCGGDSLGFPREEPQSVVAAGQWSSYHVVAVSRDNGATWVPTDDLKFVPPPPPA
jgi:hypothetical protein